VSAVLDHLFSTWGALATVLAALITGFFAGGRTKQQIEAEDKRQSQAEQDRQKAEERQQDFELKRPFYENNLM